MTRKQPKRTDRPGVDRAGRTEVHYASSNGDIARITTLLSQGADPGLPDDDGWTPLHFAAQAHSAEVASALLNAGAPVDAVDSHGNTPLLRAVFVSGGRPDLVQLLRARGADPLHPNNNEITPLRLAQTITNFDVIYLFADLLA